LRVYDLRPQRVWIDATTAKYYGRMTEEGLFQLGYSKDHRLDLLQLKVNLSVLDPLRLPLTTTVVSGHCNASCNCSDCRQRFTCAWLSILQNHCSK